MTKHKGRLLSFRGGDRSEYLSVYILSRFSYIIPVSRQEDFGVADFICFLGKNTGKYLYGEDAFLLQVKSSDDSFDFSEDGTSYLKNHANLPFFVCNIDKHNQRMELYSSWRLWYYLMCETNEIKRISFTPNVYAIDANGLGYRYEAEKLSINIALGNPILALPFNNAENDVENNNIIYEILKFWLQIEQSNLVGLRTHKAFFQGVKLWEPNILPVAENIEIYYGTGFDETSLEKATVDCLTALALKYKCTRSVDDEAFINISKLLKSFPDNLLNDLSREFRDK